MEYVKNRLRSLVDGKNSPSNEAAKAKDNKAGKNRFEKVTPGAQPKPVAAQAGGVVVKELPPASAVLPSPKTPFSLAKLAKSLITSMAHVHEGDVRPGQIEMDPGKLLNIALNHIGKLQPASTDRDGLKEFDRNLKSSLQAAIETLNSEELFNLSTTVRAAIAAKAENIEAGIESSHLNSPQRYEILKLVSSLLADVHSANAKLELEDYGTALRSFSQLESGSSLDFLIALDGLERNRNLAIEALALQGLTGPKVDEPLKALEATAIIPRHAAETAASLIKPLRDVIARLEPADPEHREVKARMSVIAAAMERLIAAHSPKAGAASDDKRDGVRDGKGETGVTLAQTESTEGSAIIKAAIEHAFNIAICPDGSVVANVSHADFSPEATRFMTSQLNGTNLTTRDWQNNQRKSVYEQMKLEQDALMTEHGQSFLGSAGEWAPKQFLRDAVGTEMLDASGQPYFTQVQRDSTIKGSDLGRFRTDAGSDVRAFQLMMVMSQTVQSLISDLIVEGQGPGSPLVTEGGIAVKIPLAVSSGKLSYQCTTPAQGGPSRVRAYGFFPKLHGATPPQPLMPPDSKHSPLTGDEPVPELVLLDPRKSFFTYTMDITIGDDGVPTLDKPVSYSYRLVEGDGE